MTNAEKIQAMGDAELRLYSRGQSKLACDAQSVNLPRAAAKHWRNASVALRELSRRTESALFAAQVR